MADSNEMRLNYQGEKDMGPESVTVLTEYDEYLGLCEIMTEDKLQKLIRKIEYVLFVAIAETNSHNAAYEYSLSLLYSI